MFLKVLSHLILKIKSFITYFKRGIEIFQFFLIFQSEVFHRASLPSSPDRLSCMFIDTLLQRNQ